jgi:hypothetical protein
MTKQKRSADPWRPAPYDDSVLAAIKALAAGNANEGQQKAALDWIVYHAAGTYDQPFRPGGVEGGRATDFACGRAFVGQQIVKMTKLTTPSRMTG